jgi:hypothetical protein
MPEVLCRLQGSHKVEGETVLMYGVPPLLLPLLQRQRFSSQRCVIVQRLAGLV